MHLKPKSGLVCRIMYFGPSADSGNMSLDDVECVDSIYTGTYVSGFYSVQYSNKISQRQRRRCDPFMKGLWNFSEAYKNRSAQGLQIYRWQ